ncbi:hypothetical protein ABPG72_002570 [Tetrahymena utriculariae]
MSDKQSNKIHILLVEEDQFQRQIVTTILNKWNYQVTAVENGRIARDKLLQQASNFNIVLLELYLPEMNGHELLGFMQEYDQNLQKIPVIIMDTSYDDNTQKAIQKGAKDFIIKLVRIKDAQGMEIEESYDTPDFIKGIIFEKAQKGLSQDSIAKEISELGYSIHQTTVSNILKRLKEGNWQSNRSNGGRKKSIGNATKRKMLIEVEKNRFLGGAAISRDTTLNPNNVSARTINKMLKEEGYIARKQKKIFSISSQNIEKRLNFCTKMLGQSINYWKKVVFSDESYLCASQFRIRFVRRLDGEDLEPEYCLKTTKIKNDLKIQVWAAITYDGPAALYFIDSNINSDVYQEILSECLPDIDGLIRGNLIFQIQEVLDKKGQPCSY